MKVARLFVFAMCLALTACGGGPSDSDVKAAVREQIREMANLFGNTTAANNAANNADITIGEKTQLPDGSYSVVVTVKAPGAPDATQAIKFLKGADGWVLKYQ